MSIADWINPIKWVTKGVEVVGNTVVNIKGAWSGNQRERDQQYNSQFMSGMQSYAAEYAPRNNRTRWDSFWDGINRMPRPLIVVTIFLYFGLAYFNPTEFQVLNLVLDGVPDQMWWVMSSVVGFYFVAREFHKSREKSMALSDRDFDIQQARIAKLRGKAIPATTTVVNSELDEVIAVHTNPSVEDWKSGGKMPDVFDYDDENETGKSRCPYAVHL